MMIEVRRLVIVVFKFKVTLSVTDFIAVSRFLPGVERIQIVMAVKGGTGCLITLRGHAATRPVLAIVPSIGRSNAIICSDRKVY